MNYESIDPVTHDEADCVAASDDVRALARAIIALALNDSDRDWTTAFCLRHATHTDANVRGCALTGLGHLSRRFRSFTELSQIETALKQGLQDESASVRAHADDAADELEQFAGGKVR